MDWFSSLFGGGDDGRDGSSAAKAIIAHSVPEEYNWIRDNLPGFKPQMQALQFIDDKPYDVLTVRSAGGEEKTIYFDISSFFGK
ncbi:MAG: hypothetical protein HYR84_08585 [Planctomycetes bacterium]|nr:hypothetical protein [Planctomycetota bacterium]